MAETQAKIGMGIHFARGDGASPEVFTNMAEVIECGFPGMDIDLVEATHTDSPGNVKEFIAGLAEGVEFDVVMNFLPNNATQGNVSGGALYDFLNSRVRRNYRITVPGSPNVTWTFPAILRSYKPATPINDRMTLSCTFKSAGAPTIA